jgi:protein-S-isoprenylcysteine O-methyltransferase Ste14
LILLGWGVFFKDMSVAGLVIGVVNFGAMVATAKTEEREMVRTFGVEYEDYMHQTKMFIPYFI